MRDSKLEYWLLVVATIGILSMVGYFLYRLM
jgi:hypothetical protein